MHTLRAESHGSASRVDKLLESAPRQQSIASQAPLRAAYIPSRSDSSSTVRVLEDPPHVT